MRAASKATNLLQERICDVSGSVLTIWAVDGTKRYEIKKGEDVLFEPVLGASKTFCWTPSSGGDQEHVSVPDSTEWLWILRAPEGSNTTVRCYSEKPVPERHLKCAKGHNMKKVIASTGIFSSFLEQKRVCSMCAQPLKGSTIHWKCPKCVKEFCFNCAEKQTWQAACQPQEGVRQLDDFLDLDKPEPPPADPGSPGMESIASGDSSPAAPRMRRRSRSSGDSVKVHRGRREVDRANRLDSVPFLGVRPLGVIQNDTVKRLDRLVRHGDVHGSWRMLARAKQLKVPPEDLGTLEAAVKVLESLSEFELLVQSGETETS